MCIELWKYIDVLSEEIRIEQNQDRKTALDQNKWIIGAIAELYYFHASVRAHLQQTNSLVEAIRAEVFGQKSIRLPHQPQNDATIADTVRRY